MLANDVKQASRLPCHYYTTHTTRLFMAPQRLITAIRSQIGLFEVPNIKRKSLPLSLGQRFTRVRWFSTLAYFDVLRGSRETSSAFSTSVWIRHSSISLSSGASLLTATSTVHLVYVQPSSHRSSHFILTELSTGLATRDGSITACCEYLPFLLADRTLPLTARCSTPTLTKAIHSSTSPAHHF